MGKLVSRVIPIRSSPSATPRAATIELPDAFDDASLEMNAAGDKFRVAVVRVAFTLRTTSVGNAAFEEVGVLRLDATPFGTAFVLEAELEVSAAGQTVELQLYDLTAAALLATLSSSSLVTERRTAAVTLAAGEALYSARLRRVGGTAGQAVSCRSVTLKRS